MAISKYIKELKDKYEGKYYRNKENSFVVKILNISNYKKATPEWNVKVVSILIEDGDYYKDMEMSYGTLIDFHNKISIIKEIDSYIEIEKEEFEKFRDKIIQKIINIEYK